MKDVTGITDIALMLKIESFRKLSRPSEEHFPPRDAAPP
jgi:hypothetical protein